MAGLEISEDLDLSNLNQKGMSLFFLLQIFCLVIEQFLKISLYSIEKIVLLDKVFFKILSSETDYDFEMNLDTFLPKLLLKLGSAEDVVRKKVTCKVFTIIIRHLYRKSNQTRNLIN